jgi:hypothetical protein
MQKFLGLFSLSCIAIALVLAAAILFSSGFFLGLIYLILFGISSLIIVLSFCTKCSCKRNCAHVLPGLATRLFKDRPPGAYTKTELTLLITSLVLILGFPQFWLIRYWKQFLYFWILNGIGLIIIVKKICIRCENQFCPFSKRLPAKRVVLNSPHSGGLKVGTSVPTSLRSKTTGKASSLKINQLGK